MAFKEVSELSAEVTISLGGVSKKTGQKNPTKVEGYYKGFKTVPDKKKKSGTTNIYFFDTAKGPLGVWGKTDLDNKMGSAVLGAMTRITQSGMRETPNGEMYVFKLEVDHENTIDVGLIASKATPAVAIQESEPSGYDSSESEEILDEEASDETAFTRPKAPAQPAVVNAAQQARAIALMNSRKRA